MRRLLLDIFAGDVGGLRSFCEADGEWEQACRLLACEAAPGWNGWALLAMLVDGETFSADAQTLTQLALRWRAAVAAEAAEGR
jgi:hypothetical protein